MSAMEVDGEVLGEETRHLPAVIEGASLTVTPQVQAGELVARLAVIEEAMRTAMVPGVDYGVIPGTDKPALLKPGSEKLGALFQLDVQLENEKIWHDDGHLTVISKAIVWHQPTGTRLGAGEGLCTTRESRYASRNASRKCPACGVEAIIKGKAEYGGGWVCFKKKNGCGAKYADDAPEIVSQVVGKIANPDLADTYNTVDKMASKRARVDAVLSVTGASALFTQDVEEVSADRPAERAPDPHGVQTARADSLSRADRMRERIYVLASEADAKRDVAAGTSAAEIATKLGETPDEDKLASVGVDVADWIAEGCTVPFTEYVAVSF